MEEQTLVCPGTSYTFIVESNKKTLRLDTFITQQFPSYSRTLFKKLIEQGCVTINDKSAKKMVHYIL
jgi:23S rRNA-/tRNA-specific pseudouridylate synthase